MAINIHRGNGGIGVGFANHFVLGVKENIGDHDKNILEKMGDAGLWMVEKFPRKIWTIMKDPKVVTIALTAFALLATSFVFYPITTYLLIKAGLALLPTVPYWAVHLSVYIATISVILSTACRAEGRFLNSKLMNEFYN